MEIIDNINQLLGDDLKQTITPGSKLKIAASCFSIYAFEALKKELETIDSLEFIFTSPTFVPSEVTDSVRKERREFHIPKAERERSLYGTEFEIQLQNKLTQRAIAKECAEWMRRKATFRSNRGKAPMQQFACVKATESESVYMPLHGFTAVDLGYQQGNAVSNIVNKIDEPAMTAVYLSLFDQIWNDPEKLEDVTERLCDHIASVYQENSPERIYFLMLYNIFNEFLDDINEDVLPNDLTGYQDSLIWKKLFNFQRDAATGIINKLETYNGCILADSVGLGKTFTALAVIKYYELRNRSVLVLCPKKLADNWLNYNRNLKTNIFAKDRFNYDVLCHTDLQRTSGESFGTPLNRVNWGNYDLVVIDESHNFRNNDAFKERETRYQKLMNQVIREGVKTKVLMLSATPVNNRFNDLRNQLALAYEGDSENLSTKLKTDKDIDEIFRHAQAAFNAWSKLPPEERTAAAILERSRLRLLRAARQRDHRPLAQAHPDLLRHHGHWHVPRAPQAAVVPLPAHPSHRCDRLQRHLRAAFAAEAGRLRARSATSCPAASPSTRTSTTPKSTGGSGKLRQADREKSLQALMTVNLLKRLESSVRGVPPHAREAGRQPPRARSTKIEAFNKTGRDASFADVSPAFENAEPDEDDEFPEPDDASIGGKVQINLADMDLPSWEHDLRADLALIEALAGRDAEDHPSRRRQAPAPQDPDQQQARLTHQPRQQEGAASSRRSPTRPTTSTSTSRQYLLKSHRHAHRPSHRHGRPEDPR